MVKRRVVTALLAVLVMAVPLFAQDVPANAPTRDDVVKLLTVMHARQQMDDMTNLMASQIKQQMRESWLREHPNTPEASLKKIDAAIDEAMNAVSRDEMMTMLVDVYRRHLTKDDVQAAVGFYSSPAGQHMLEKMPIITQEVMKESSAKYDAKKDEIEEKIAEALKELSEESHGDTTPKK